MLFVFIFCVIKAFVCEGRILGRIVDGENAEEKDYPFLVQLKDEIGLFHCGASVISPSYVLTAAHCVHGKTKNNVLVHYRESSGKNKSNERRIARVSQIIAHPEFNLFSTNNDIALLKLESPLSVLVNSVCLANKSPNDGDDVTVIGWGRIGVDGPFAKRLQKLDLKVINNKQCKEKHGTNRWWITETKLCAWASYKNSCDGDSGGPLLHTNGDHLYVVGVVSFGMECGTTDVPSVYTRISKFITWITQNVENEKPCVLY